MASHILPHVKMSLFSGFIQGLKKSFSGKDLAKDVIPPTDSNFLRPQFLEIHDLYSYLIQYCENRNIVQDPMSQSLDDLLTEDEALRLSQELEAIELPS